MTWLKKSEPTEAWEIEDEENIGDLELARQIREICNSVADARQKRALPLAREARATLVQRDNEAASGASIKMRMPEAWNAGRA